MKVKKAKRTQKRINIPLDTSRKATRRGRPGVDPSEVLARANNFRSMFWKSRLDTKKREWVRDKPQKWSVRLVKGRTKTRVKRALASLPSHVRVKLQSLGQVILKTVQGQKFPKKVETQLDFLADSLAALGEVTPQRSREICAAERRRIQKLHKILRKEFYVECSCGYKGPARDDACRKCGAEIGPSIGQFV